MTFDPNRRAEVFLTAEVAPSPASRNLATPQSATTQLPPESFLAGDVNDAVLAGRWLRSEAEQLIAWCNRMGDGTGAKTWTETQQEYAAASRLQLRERAEKVKTLIARCKNSQLVLELIFNDKYGGQYPESVTKQARLELGI